MSKEVKKEYTKRGLPAPSCKRGGKHHSQAFHRIVAGIKSAKKKGEATKAKNPYAIAMSRLGKRKAFK